MALPLRAHADDYAGQYLIAEKTRVALLEDKSIGTDILQFRTQSPLPIIRAKQGKEVRVRLMNELNEDIAIQLYGVRGPETGLTAALPAKTDTVTPDMEVVFTPPDAGTFWIGPLLNASRQRDLGLWALLIVDEQAALQHMIDVPLIVDDWLIDEKGLLDQNYNNLERLIAEGRMGNWFTVNRAFKPTIPVPRGAAARLRVANVANMRTMQLSLRNANAKLLALDGQPLAKPQTLNNENLTLAPGQRADLLVPELTKQAALVLDLAEDVVEIAFLEPVATEASIKAINDLTLPANPLPSFGPSPRDILVEIQGGEKGGLQQADVGIETLDMRQMLERGLAWSLNRISGLGGPVLFSASRGETLRLTLDNKTNFEQVFCVHGHTWTMIEQDGQPIANGVQRDTAIIPAKSTAKLLMVAGQPGAWVIQSTQAERSEGGLIGTFKVEE